MHCSIELWFCGFITMPQVQELTNKMVVLWLCLDLITKDAVVFVTESGEFS